MTNIFKRFNPRTHLINRIWFSTLSIILSSLLVLGVLSQIFFSSFFLKSSIKSAQTSLAYTANILDDMLQHIISRFTEICGTEDFFDYLVRLKDVDSIEYTQLNLDLQDALHELSDSNTLIDTAVIVDRQGNMYHSLSRGLRQSTYSITLGHSESEINGITLLSRTDHPLKHTKDVIPLAIPLKAESTTDYAAVVNDIENAEAVLYLMFDADAFKNYIKAYTGADAEGVVFLITDSGKPIDPTYVSIPGILPADAAASITSANNSVGYVKDDGRYVFFQKLSKQGLFLVNSIEKSQLMSSLYIIQQFLIAAAIASVIIVTLLTKISASYISKPLNHLMNAVRSIENGTYSSDMMLTSLDEMGLLSHAIDSMYHTTQDQFEQIRLERKAKYNTNVRLLTEQINPHFLYNTLEYINMEVYNGHTQNASMMIQNLGEFLRIGLNVGSDTITISGELDHVRAYVAIMDHRFDHNISFTSTVDPTLADYPILKIILQPLVENSIRHGFMLDASNSYIAFPMIHITVRRDDKYIYLSVTDNGVGIDVEKVSQIMHTGLDESRPHIGLNNVYQRLQLSYGESADISFTSVPYYQNTVCVQIPFDEAKGAKIQ